MIGALVAILSLTMTSKLVAAGTVAKTMTVTNATNASPIVLTTSEPHGFARPIHAVVDQVGGNDAANGLWVLTPTGPTTLALSTFDQAGVPAPVTGSGAYTSGGRARIAFPDGSILLGWRNVNMSTAMTSPRIVFVPLGSGKWEHTKYGGVIPPATFPQLRADMTAEQQRMQLATGINVEGMRFEVHVTGCANPPDPDFGDFDVTQALYRLLYQTIFEQIGPDVATVLKGDWQKVGLDYRGQKWVGIIEIDQAVTDAPLAYVPAGTIATMTVNFEGASSTDAVVIALPPPS